MAMDPGGGAYNDRKRRNFVHLNTQTFERWQKVKNEVTQEKSFYSDSDFAGYLLEKYEAARAVIAEKEIQKDLQEEVTRNTRFARGTQVLHIPRDLKHELDSISVQSGLHSTVKTVRFLVDAFHDRIPDVKLKTGNGKKTNTSSVVWDASRGKPGTSTSMGDDSMQSIIKNVMDVLEAEDKGTIQTIDSMDAPTPAARSEGKAMVVENVTVQVNNGTVQEDGLKAKDDATQHAIDVRVKRDENMIEIGPSGGGEDIWSSMILEQVILGGDGARNTDSGEPSSKKRKAASQPREKVFRCNTCAEILTKEADIENHVYKMHGAWPFICRLCQLCLSEEEDMIEHVDTAHSAIYLCGFAGCNYSAAREFSIRGHFITTHTRGTSLPVSILKGKLWDMYVNRRTTFYGLTPVNIS